MKGKTKQLSAFLMVVLIISIALVPVVSSKVDNSDTKEIETLVQIPIPEVRVNIPFQTGNESVLAVLTTYFNDQGQ